MASESLTRLAHGWKLRAGSYPAELAREFVRPAVRAAPASVARRLGRCEIALEDELDGGAASRWTLGEDGLTIWVATAGCEAHDVALEVLVCLGQALWDRLEPREKAEYWGLLADEIGRGIEGEIDEQAYAQKRAATMGRSTEARWQGLLNYGQISFGSTAAEYVHSLWHDVTVRTGREHLPAADLRKRFELLARWFPPDRGYRLFTASGRARKGVCGRGGRAHRPRSPARP